MNRQPDVEAFITLLKHEDGGRQTPVSDGYRPQHLVKDNYLASGVQQYYDKETVQPGESVLGTITFISPEAYPKSLWVGKVINIQEGRRLIGYAEIMKIFNDSLKAEK